MCTPPPSAGGGGNEPPTKFSKRRGVAGKEGVTFFRGGGSCNFHIKNKLKSGILNDKKVYKQKYFSIITKKQGVHEKSI